MPRKDLRKMKRLELLDMMIEQGKQLEEQVALNEQLQERLQKLEVQQQASDDRIGHLKDQIQEAAMKNDRLRAKADSLERAQKRMAEENATLQRENTVLATKLDDALERVRQAQGAQLKGLGDSDKMALRTLADRMESVLEQTQAADAERTARFEAILVNQQEILDGMSAGGEATTRGRHAAAAPALDLPVVKPLEEEQPAEEKPLREKPAGERPAEEKPAQLVADQPTQEFHPILRIGPLGKKKKKKK